MSKRRSHRRQQPVTVQSAQEGEFIPRQGGRAEAFTFGDPMPVLDGRGILDYLECWSNGRWYEPPLSMEGLAKAVGSSVYLQSGLKFKRNMLAKTFIPHRLLSRATFEQFSLDWLTFGSAYLEQPRSRLGTRMPLQAPLAKYMRRGTDLETFYQVRSWKDEHEFEKGSVIQLREADINQEIYGVPEWFCALQSALLNESATLFRRKYYNNGSHAGFILYMTDAAQNEEDIDAAKDEFGSIKNISRDDQLAGLRVYPQLMGVVPQNAGGFGSISDAAAVWASLELEPMQARLQQVNELLGDEVISFNRFEVVKSN